MEATDIADDRVPFDDAQAKLGDWADAVVSQDRELVLTKDGVGYVALIDARRLEYFHALEAERACLVLADDALQGLNELAAGRVLSEAELDEALSPDGGLRESDSAQK